MNWTGKISFDGTEMEIYDHNQEYVETVENDGSGFSKQTVRNVAFDNMEGSQPSAYNQQMLACMATNQIEIVPESDGS